MISIPLAPSRSLYFHVWACLLIAAAACLIRWPVWVNYQPVLFVDSQGYLDYAANLGRGDFSQYDGFRVPGYSVFLLLCGRNLTCIWVVQTLLGIVTGFLCYGIAKCAGCSWRMSVLSAVWYELGLHFIFLEAAVLSETLSLFILLGAMYVSLLYLHDRQRKWVLWGIGVLCGLLALIRPQFVFLGGWLGLLLGFFLWRTESSLLPVAGALMRVWSPWTVMILGLCTANALLVGQFTLSTTTGYSLLNHSGRFIEYADDAYGDIRDFYLRYREERSAAVEATGGNVSFLSVPLDDLRREKGLTYAGFSAYLTKMSKDLFVQHPFLYLRSVAEAWGRFWRIPLIWYPERWNGGAAPLGWAWVWMTEKLVWFGCCVGFLVLTPRLLLRLRSKCPSQCAVVILLSVVWLSSILQALTNFGENARYAIPVLPLVPIILVAYFSGRSGLPSSPS